MRQNKGTGTSMKSIKEQTDKVKKINAANKSGYPPSGRSVTSKQAAKLKSQVPGKLLANGGSKAARMAPASRGGRGGVRLSATRLK